jgi:hypothetical protein
MKNNLSICTVTLILIMAFAGCRRFQPIPSPTAVTPTPKYCAFVSNPGPPPPEVVERAKENFNHLQVSGIRGKMEVSAYGDYYCDDFSVKAVDFSYLIVVRDLEDQTTMREIAEKLKESSRNSVQGWNMGSLSIGFMSGMYCNWDEVWNECSSIEPIINP